MLKFAVNGDVLSTTAPELQKQLSALLESDRAVQSFDLLEIDLRSAAMVDSVGLSLLVWAWKAVKERGARLRLRIASPDIERTFRFTRLSSHIDVVREP